MPRKKRRLATIPQGGEWDPLTPDQRQLVEKAYGQGPLSDVVWVKIQLATAMYNSTAALERAVPIDDFLRKLDKLRTAAREVSRCLPEISYRIYKSIDPQLNGAERQIAIQEKYFELSDFDPTPEFPIAIYELLSHTLAAVEDVASFAHAEFGDPEVGYVHGLAWNNWIYWLTIIVKEHRLPHSARKDSDKRIGEMSPFVILVKELQKHLSPATQLTIESRQVDALAQAINRARRGMDTDCKFTDVIDLALFGDAEEELRNLLGG